MVINIRGTSGSGKSTIVRAVMATYDQRMRVNTANRRQPIGYLCHREGHRSLWVPGHYETPCGGCDTLHSLNEVYASVRSGSLEGHDVLYEGVIVGDDVNRCLSLHKDLAADPSGRGPLLVVGLDVDIETCLQSVVARRIARGDERPLNPKNTADRVRRIEAGLRRLELGGVEVQREGRDGALALLLERLGL